MIFIILSIGFLLNFLAYGNLWPFLIFSLVFIISKSTSFLFINPTFNSTERLLPLWIISICFLFSGVTELCINQYGSINTVGPDATLFFDISLNPSWDFRGITSDNTEEILALKEDFIPLLIWNSLYRFFDLIGITLGRFITSAINTLLIVWSSYIGLDILRRLEKNYINEKLYIYLFSLNGMYIMFGSLHLRGSFLVFAIGLLMNYWIKWINEKNISNSIYLILISLISIFTLDFLRGGMSLVPIVLLCLYLTSKLLLVIFKNSNYANKNFFYFLLSIGLLSLFMIFKNIEALTAPYEYYNLLSQNEMSDNSISQFFYKLPVQIFFVFRILYMVLSPFPIWVGQDNSLSTFYLLKSFFGLYSYMTLPAYILGIREVFSSLKNINLDRLFLILIYLTFLFLVSITSMELRHLIPFYIPYIVIISSIDFSNIITQSNYKKLLLYLVIFFYLAYSFYIPFKFNSIWLLFIFLLIPYLLLKDSNNEKKEKRK